MVILFTDGNNLPDPSAVSVWTKSVIVKRNALEPPGVITFPDCIGVPLSLFRGIGLVIIVNTFKLPPPRLRPLPFLGWLLFIITRAALAPVCFFGLLEQLNS
jgi:hypothetical protein